MDFGMRIFGYINHVCDPIKIHFHWIQPTHVYVCLNRFNMSAFIIKMVSLSYKSIPRYNCCIYQNIRIFMSMKDQKINKYKGIPTTMHSKEQINLVILTVFCLHLIVIIKNFNIEKELSSVILSVIWIVSILILMLMRGK